MTSNSATNANQSLSFDWSTFLRSQADGGDGQDGGGDATVASVASTRASLRARFILHTVLICVLVLGPVIGVLIAVTQGQYYPLWSWKPQEERVLSMELVRWLLIPMALYLGYWGTLIGIALVTWTLSKRKSFAKGSHASAQQQKQALTLGFVTLRGYIAFFVASLLVLITALVIFPFPSEDNGFHVIRNLLKKAGDAKTTTDAASAPSSTDTTGPTPSSEAAEVAANSGDIIPSARQSFYLTHSSIALLLFSGLLLLEKFMVQRLAVMFHYHSAAERISENNFALRCIKRLKRQLIESRRLTPEQLAQESSATIGGILFDALVNVGGVDESAPTPRSENISTSADASTTNNVAFTIGPAHMLPFLTEQEAGRFFDFLDPEGHGDLQKSEMQLAIAHIFEEREALVRTVHDQSRIVKKVDRLMLALVVIIWFSAALYVMNAGASTIWASLGSVGTFGFIFSSAARTAFESIIFVIFSHPFDVGDRVLIDKDLYTVKELGLWSSTFYGPGKRLTYIANSVLRSKTIVNVRRSPLQNELISIKILPSTPQEKLALLEQRLNQFLKEHSRDYVPPILLKGYRFVDKDHMIMDMTLQHRANFQNVELKDSRTKVFMLFLKDAVQECGIAFAPSY